MTVNQESSAKSSPLSQLSESQKRQLTEILDRYLCSLEQAAPLNTDDLKKAYPDLADVLTAYFSKLDALHEVAGGYQPSDVPIADVDGSFDLGDFSILKEIGRGGMGIVYEARQRSLDRRVALKLLPMAAMLDSRQIARFKNESHAAGQLQHPNIVPVYSFGVERGIYFYVMRLIDGIPMDDWIAQHGADASWRAVLQWVIDAADALQCAHETGVVHRDIKPSNLLLDDRQQIWITDFGLARCQSDVSLTRSGDVVGTMRYMSPEQAAGQSELVDHRTDIYSLAATLFEMLTQQPAVVGEDPPALLRTIDQDTRPRIRNHRSDVPSDLDVVLQKAMARHRDQRYLSARAFADDLQAVLDGRPTVAKPPLLVDLASRWVVRHQRAVFAGSLMLTASIAWIVVSSLVMLKKSYDADASQIQADRYFNQARATVDDLGSGVAEQLASIPGAEHVRQSLLRQTFDYYEDFVAQASHDPKLQAELASTHSRIGSVVKELTSSTDAIPHYRSSAQIYQQLSEEGKTSPAIRRKMAQNSNHLGLALVDAGQLAEAKRVYEQAIELQKELVAKGQKSMPGCDTELALTTNNYALLLRELGQSEAASDLFKQTIAQFTTIIARSENDHLARRGLAAALGNLSSLQFDSNPQESIRLLEQAIDHQLAASDLSTNRLCASMEIATSYNNVGAAYLRDDQFAKSEQAFLNAIRLQRQLHSIAPSVDLYRRDLAMSLNNLATVLQKQSKHIEAVSASREAIGFQRALLGDTVDPRAHRRMGAMLHNSAASLMAINRDADALAALRTAIGYQESVLKLLPGNHEARSLLLRHYSQLIRCQVRNQQWRDLEVTSSAYRRAAGDDPQQLLVVAGDLAEATNMTPKGRQRDRTASAVAATLTSARAAGLAVEPLLLQEPFAAVADEPSLRRMVRP